MFKLQSIIQMRSPDSDACDCLDCVTSEDSTCSADGPCDECQGCDESKETRLDLEFDSKCALGYGT